MHYAQINLATRIVEAESETHSAIDASHMIRITEGQYGTTLGKRHNAQTDEFEYVAPPPIRELTKVEYLKRFTQAERIAIRNFAKTNDAAFDYIELLNATEIVHLDDPMVADGLAAFEQAGKIGAGRAAEIRA